MRPILSTLLLTATLALAVSITTAQTPPPTTQPKMYAVLLGTGYPRPDNERAGPATAIVIGEKVFLIDAGRGVTMRPAAANLAPKNICAVFLTHLHSDHIDGLPDVFHTTWQFGRAGAFELYGPAGTKNLVDGMIKIYAADIHIRRDLTEKLPAVGATINLHTVKEGVVYQDEDVRVTAFLVDHAPVEPAFGYRFDQIERNPGEDILVTMERSHVIASIVISGDTHPTENLIRYAKNADVLIHEAYLPQITRPTDTASDDEPWFTRYHSTAAEAGDDAARADVKLLVLTHLIPHRTGNADAQFQSEAAKSFHGQIIVGHDLMRIEIPATQNPRKDKIIYNVCADPGHLMNVVLLSTYELGHQPFGLASPAAWLAEIGAKVTCLDLSREDFREAPIREAELIAFYVPMHTATRLAVALLPRVREVNPNAHICFYGLYAPVNADYLRELGAHSILGGEFEEGLVHLVEQLAGAASNENVNSRAESNVAAHSAVGNPEISLGKQKFRVPQRGGLPALAKYAHLIMPDGGYRVVGYTEASRGCKHLCRHCPIVPVYDGTFRIVQREIVLEDIRRQVAVGAQHISFGDPDFFNGPTHALAIVQEMHLEFPNLSYDATIKIEHLLNHAEHLTTLRDTGCIFVTSAVESVDDLVLDRLAKGHARAGFARVVEIFRNVGLTLQPTFVPFSPWTTPRSYLDLLQVLAEQDLVENVAPIQLAIRLLIPAGSRLLELPEIRDNVEPFDASALVYPWKHSDPRVDALAREVSQIVEREEKLRQTRVEIFTQIWHAAARLCDGDPQIPDAVVAPQSSRVAIPHMNEPWYCCAEPSSDQLVSIGSVKSSVTHTEKTLPQPDAFV